LDGHEVFHHKKAAGVIYQAALRAELTAALPLAFGPVSEKWVGRDRRRPGAARPVFRPGRRPGVGHRPAHRRGERCRGEFARGRRTRVGGDGGRLSGSPWAIREQFGLGCGSGV